VSRDARSQFEPLADAYAHSHSHTQGRTLAILADLARPSPDDVAIDVATGAGSTALALAPRLRAMVAHDLTGSMVRRTLQSARERGIRGVLGAVSPAEALPFRSGRFDLVVCRAAAHHFDDVPRAIAEMARVLRAGGRLVLSDQAASRDPEVRRLQQTVEVLHDPTHGSTFTPDEWRNLLADAGLRDVTVVGGAEERLSELDEPTNVAEWCRRSRTPPESETRLRAALASAAPRLRAALGVEGEGTSQAFRIWKLVVSATR
jgi:ubiquinone/menaquinone biosynthesis C-methylase UbiE